MYQTKRPLENYIGASWLAQQCQVNQGVIHRYAVRQRLRYYRFMGIRYLDRNDAIALVKQLTEQHHDINLPKIVGAIERYHSKTKIRSV
ncbi:MAG: hypothetical protein GVY17_03095 [Cyanobacteria bacterium]|jgi:hypothetical protein|nr:hypothetical protein [Cyanobacteria bacterium GSL.Bin21]